MQEMVGGEAEVLGVEKLLGSGCDDAVVELPSLDTTLEDRVVAGAEVLTEIGVWLDDEAGDEAAPEDNGPVGLDVDPMADVEGDINGVVEVRIVAIDEVEIVDVPCLLVAVEDFVDETWGCEVERRVLDRLEDEITLHRPYPV